MKPQSSMTNRRTPQSVATLCLSAVIAVGAGVLALSPASLLAQTPASQVGTLLVAHGGGPQWDAGVDSLANAVNTGGPVVVSLLMGPGAATHRFQDGVRQLVDRGAKEIVVVPVFVSSHSGHIEQIRYLAGLTDSLDDAMMHHLHMAGITRPTARVPMRVTPALDNAPELAHVLTDRAKALTGTPANRSLFLIGHGPNGAEDYAAWMVNLRQVADSVEHWAGFHDVKIGLVRDDAPAAVRAEAVREIRETIRLQHAVTRDSVIVVPILVSSGSVGRTKIPKDLHDQPVVYRATPLLPHPAMARWVEARVREASRQRPAQAPQARQPSAHAAHR
jgi:sirohydrochlorin ferrochelatase